MRNRLETVPFKDTPEQKERLLNIIAEYKDVKGSLVQVLKLAQEVYGYLPLEVQETVADGLDIPLEEVYGVVSFYSLFTIYPKGRHRISVCLGTACYVKGSAAIYAAVQKELGIERGCTSDGMFSIDACRCVGACGLAPVLTVDGEVYGKLKVEDVSTIINKFRERT